MLKLLLVSVDVESSKEGEKLRRYIVRKLEELGFKKVQFSVMAGMVTKQEIKKVDNLIASLEKYRDKLWFHLLVIELQEWQISHEGNSRKLLSEINAYKRNEHYYSLKDIANSRFKPLLI